jgi:hypothetical protein
MVNVMKPSLRVRQVNAAILKNGGGGRTWSSTSCAGLANNHGNPLTPRAPLFSAACLAAVAKVFFWHLADVDVGSEHVRPEG